MVPVTPSPPAEAARTAVRAFAIDRVNDRERLYFDLDERRVEIGGCLTESERAWLFAVLRRWLGEARPAPAWARGARPAAKEDAVAGVERAARPSTAETDR